MGIITFFDQQFSDAKLSGDFEKSIRMAVFGYFFGKTPIFDKYINALLSMMKLILFCVSTSNCSSIYRVGVIQMSTYLNISDYM